MPGERRGTPPVRSGAGAPAAPRHGARAERPGDSRTRLARAWLAHPVVAFFQHRRKLAFYRQLLALVKAGVAMPTALRELAVYAPGGMRSALLLTADDVEGGAGLTEAMERHSSVFDDPMLQLLFSGEETGTLERAVSSIVAHLEELQRLRWKLLVAALWPIYLLGTVTFAGPLLELPFAILRGAPRGDLLGVYVVGLLRNVAVVGGAIAALLLVPFVVAALDLGLPWERLKLAIPGLSAVSRNGWSARFLAALSLAVRAGMPVSRSLRLAARASGSVLVASRAEAAVRRVERGGKLTDGIEALGLLRKESLGQVAIAERTGSLDDTLETLSREAQEAALRAIRILALLVLVVVAIVALLTIVRGIFAVIFGPIWDYQHLPDQIGRL